MNTKVRNTVVAAVVAVFASSALALGNAGSMACIDEGASPAVKRAQSEALLVSATPNSTEAYEAASDGASQAKEQQLKRKLEALGVWVD